MDTKKHLTEKKMLMTLSEQMINLKLIRGMQIKLKQE